MMQRLVGFAIVVVAVIAVVVVHHWNDQADAPSTESTLILKPVAQAAPQPAKELQAPPSPTPTTASPPEKIPAPIEKALALVHEQEVHRPMNRVAKNWYGCATAQGYSATLSLIRAKDPGSADHFKGHDADCAPLTTGAHITVIHLDAASGLAQISIDDTRQVFWTDASALAGDVANK